MASQVAPSKDAAAKSRIITHMNSDHQESLIRYLQHYAHLSAFSARNAHLTDLTFSSLTILSSPRTPHLIPIDPPMTSWSDARPRVVAMDAEATSALGQSSITVKRYKRPRGFWAVVWVAAFVTFLAFSRRANFRPGSVLFDGSLYRVPGFAGFCWRIQRLVIWPMVVLHAGEALYMARGRLERHAVRMFGVVWWLWVGSTFVEGYGASVRFDEVVREEEERRKGAKH